MTTTIIIAICVAVILFIMWGITHEKVTENHDRIQILLNKFQKLSQETTVTYLTPETMLDAVKSNGLVPVKEKDAEWIMFTYQGEKYFISCYSLPIVQFYVAFNFDENTDIQILKQASEFTMTECPYGRISIENENTISFRVFGVEKTKEHLALAFPEYLRLLGELINCHRYVYSNMLNEKQNSKPDESLMPAKKPSNIMS